MILHLEKLAHENWFRSECFYSSPTVPSTLNMRFHHICAVRRRSQHGRKRRNHFIPSFGSNIGQYLRNLFQDSLIHPSVLFISTRSVSTETSFSECTLGYEPPSTLCKSPPGFILFRWYTSTLHTSRVLVVELNFRIFLCLQGVVCSSANTKLVSYGHSEI